MTPKFPRKDQAGQKNANESRSHSSDESSDEKTSEPSVWHSKPFVRPLRTSDYVNRPARTGRSPLQGFHPHGPDNDEPDLVYQDVKESKDAQGLARLPYDTSIGHIGLQPGHRGFTERFLSLFNGDEPANIVVHGDVGLYNFMRHELAPTDSMLNVVVLTGLTKSPWATTCGEYISAVWPKSSKSIEHALEWLQHHALNTASRQSDVRLNAKSSYGSIEMSPLPGHHSGFVNQALSFRMKGRPEQCAPIVEAVSWLSSALQASFTNVLEKSRIIMIAPSGHERILIKPESTVPIGVVPNGCWMPLLPCTTTATDFPVPFRRPGMFGMEVSFDLMCHLCGLEYAVTEGDGIVLYGERSIVYPMRKGGDSVQWHFEPREILSAGSETKDLPNPRLMVDDLDTLREVKRHFLGLWGESQITLGTSLSESSRIFSSNSPEVERERTPDGTTIGASINVVPRVITGTLQRTYKYAQSRKSIFCADFEAKMHSLINVPVLLYSPSERRCWMVPYLNVIYHLARARAQYQRTLGVEIPPCELAADSGQAVFEIIQSYCHNPFRGTGFDWNEREKAKAAAVVAYIDQVWAALDCASRNTHKMRRHFRTQIIGYEMADIARARIRLRMKRHQLQAFATGWTPFLDQVPLVLFYEGLFDPIIAYFNEDLQNACTRTMWRSIPRGFDLLTATIPCLRYLAEDFNDRDDKLENLTRRHRWHCPGNRAIFTPCRRNSAHHCDRLQELKAISQPLGDAIRSPRASSYRHHPFGAVVFRYRDNARVINNRSSATASSANARRRRETDPVPTRRNTPAAPESRVGHRRQEENLRGGEWRRRQPKHKSICVIL